MFHIQKSKDKDNLKYYNYRWPLTTQCCNLQAN